MKYQGLRRWGLIVSLFVASATVSRGIILTFFYDIFGSCVDPETANAAEPSLFCEYGPQFSLNLLAAVFFLALATVLLYKTTALVRRNALLGMAAVYVLLMMFSWRFLNNLSESFAIFQGPQTFTEYLFVLYANLETLIVASAVAVMYNIGVASNRFAIDEAGRNAPRDLTVASSKKTVSKKPAAKKTTTRKVSTKKAGATRKSTTSKKTTTKKTSAKKTTTKKK